MALKLGPPLCVKCGSTNVVCSWDSKDSAALVWITWKHECKDCGHVEEEEVQHQYNYEDIETCELRHSEDLVSEDIKKHLNSTKWLQALISQRLSSKLTQILKYYHYWCDDQDEDNSEKTTKHYPEKGILLHSIDIKREDREWLRWSERHHVYLLETGQFVKVKVKSKNDPIRTSFIHSADSHITYTKMEVWSSEQVDLNQQKLVESLAELLGIS